ncbi:MAG: hypothetical protein HYV61_12860 [Candidatus Rokubacteria bacterium]|nr:hypothetical protein [Candidatus Rokubacteria bacterium]
MSEVALSHPAVEPAESPLTPESWGKLGMWIFLVGDAMGFGVLLAGYGAMRYGSADWPIPYDHLGINLTAFMTFLLICSSVTMVKGLEAVKYRNRDLAKMYLALTALGGALFLGLQAYEWTKLIGEGLKIWGNPYRRGDLPARHHAPGLAAHHRDGAGVDLQRGGDHRALLALRGPGLDHGLHLHLSPLVWRARWRKGTGTPTTG